MNRHRVASAVIACALVLPACGLKSSSVSSQVTFQQGAAPAEDLSDDAPQPSPDSAPTVPTTKRTRKQRPEPTTVAEPARAAVHDEVAEVERELEAMIAEIEDSRASRPGDSAAPEGKKQAVPQDPAPPPRPDHGSTLMGHEFQSIEVTTAGEPRRLVDGTVIEVRFERRKDGDVTSWYAGCNYIGGPVTVRKDVLVVTPQDGTAVGCAPEHQQQDDWLTEFMDTDPTWDLNSGATILTLTSDQTTIRLRATS